MVCKEEIHAWFKQLDGPKRIDFMCGLLRMCVPLELRYLGTYVEDLGKRDYHHLREAEIRSNNASELAKLINVTIRGVRNRLNVALALLHSFNAECASVLFRILTSIQSVGLTEELLSDDDSMEEMLLLFTMAANHPAFTIDQRLTLCDILLKFQKLKAPVLPGFDGRLCRYAEANLSSGPSEKAYIKQILVKGFRWRPSDKKYEIQMQITWSDDRVSEIYKTHQELYEFHVELIKLFPEEAGAHRQDRRIPYLHANKRQCGSQEEFSEQILPNVREYVEGLVRLPERIQECNHVHAFFCSTEAVPVNAVMLPPECDDLDDDDSENDRNGPADLIMQGSCQNHHSMMNAVPTVTTNHRQMYTCRKISPTLHSSPLPSPLSSPHISPSCHLHGSRPTSPSSKPIPESIPKWLKQLRLHKYSDRLSKYTMEELLALTEKDLEREELTLGARKKLLGEIEKCKKMLSMNGMVQDTDSGSICTTPPSPTIVTWHTPPTHSSYLPIPHSNMPGPSGTTPYSSNLSSADSSPSCSEYSSPSASPLPTRRLSDHQIDSSCSDENEKDGGIQCQQQIVNANPPGGPPTMTRMVRDTQMLAMQPSRGDENKVAPDGAVHVVCARTSGYTSDGSPLMPFGYQMRLPVLQSPRPQFKPLPLVPNNGQYPMMPKSVMDNNSNSTSPIPTHLRQPTPELYPSPSAGHTLPVPTVPMVNMPSPVDNISKQYMALHDTNSIPQTNSRPGSGGGGDSSVLQQNVPSPCHMNNIAYSGTPNNLVPMVAENNLNGKSNNGIATSGLNNVGYGYSLPAYNTSVNMPVTTTTFSGIAFSPKGQPTPSHTPTSQNDSGCSECGCSAECPNSTNLSTTTPTPPLPYFRYPPGVHPHPQNMFSHIPPAAYLPPNSNGLVSPLQNLPFGPLQSVNFPNGLSPEVLYGGQFNMVGGSQPVASHLVAHMQGIPFMAQNISATLSGNNVPKPPKVISCYNCGQGGHRASECKEPTMDSITHAGHFHINYKPKLEPDDNR